MNERTGTIGSWWNPNTGAFSIETLKQISTSHIWGDFIKSKEKTGSLGINLFFFLLQERKETPTQKCMSWKGYVEVFKKTYVTHEGRGFIHVERTINEKYMVHWN